MKSIYLINPAADPQAYFSAEIYAGWGYAPAVLVADLVMTTVAAFIPEGFDIALCDDHLTPVDFDKDVDIVALTGKTSQLRRMLEIARAFRRRGCIVMIGGPVATLDPSAVRDECDILVQGEIEDIAPTLFDDLLHDTWRTHYRGSRPALSSSPIPRWDLYPTDRAISGCIQTTRGCPFSCEFCEVPEFVGRKQRRKSPAQVLSELDVLYDAGFRMVFIADDNFTVYRQKAKELLDAIRWWNERRPDGPMLFSTQVSIDAARDDELLDMCAKAGLATVFIGIETPNADSLIAAGKRQNIGRDLIEDVKRFLARRIMVISGLIVGFDTDGPDIFDIQREFIHASPIPIFSLGALVAPMGAPLRTRLAAEGRLTDDTLSSSGSTWRTNIVPKRMAQEALLSGVRQLSNDIYSPEAFGKRLLSLVQNLGPYRGPSGDFPRHGHAQLIQDTSSIIKRLITLGPEEKKLAKRVVKDVIGHNQDAMPVVQSALSAYAQIRYFYDRADRTCV